MDRRRFLTTMCAAPALAQTVYAPKGPPAVYSGPHKPHTKLSELKAKHKGKTMWSEVIVDDKHLRSDYLFLPPGKGHPKAMHPDTRAWWVVMEGEVRFSFETKEPFVARKGSIVQVPMQTFFEYEVVGAQPALIFETNIAGAKTLYADKKDAPLMPGHEWIAVTPRGRTIGNWTRNNKPHNTYDDLAAKLEKGELKGTQRIVEDDRGAANFIYGHNSKLPPLDEKARGHYHPEGAEYWLIMSGKIRYPIEKVGVIIAEAGDVVYVPAYTWHFPRWWGDGPSCRLALNGFPYIAHLFDPH
ncbi:MAG: cupin domain-containing protein [Acidobacteria bacterium]|nr:cupin domain-containing protein [Acidobacteriota bacterium]